MTLSAVFDDEVMMVMRPNARGSWALLVAEVCTDGH